MGETTYFTYAFIKKCVYIYAQAKKASKHVCICMILYGIFTNIQKATILQTSKNTPCMKKAKSQKAFQPQP